MKLSYLFFVTILLSSQLRAQQVTRDTIFIHRSDPGEEYNAIYIDTSLKSEWYEQIAGFKIYNDDPYYASTLKQLHKGKKS